MSDFLFLEMTVSQLVGSPSGRIDEDVSVSLKLRDVDNPAGPTRDNELFKFHTIYYLNTYTTLA